MGTTRRRGTALPVRATVADIEPLLREHAERLREVTEAFRRCAAAGLGHAEAGPLEERAARLLDRAVSHAVHVHFETERRGLDPARVNAAFAAISRLPGVDAFLALIAALPGGPGGPEARHWAAAAGTERPAAMYTHALLLEFSSRDAAGSAEARALLDRAAALGHAPSLRLRGMARMQEEGARARRDGEEMLRRAAERGSAGAGFLLAMHLGPGAPDPGPEAAAEAASLLRAAATGGHAEAQLALGTACALGNLGLERDHAEAKRWLALAARAHCAVAADWMERYGDLTPGDYASALWIDRWTPTDLPEPPAMGPLGLALSVGFLALLVVGTLAGNSLVAWLLFGFLAILMHEFGHFWVGRRLGIPTAVFTVGTGPAVRSFTWRGDALPMRIDLRLLPLMGSVLPYMAPRSVWEHRREAERRAAAGEPPPPLPRFDESEEPEPVTHLVPRRHRLAMLGGGLAVNLVAAFLCLFAYERASPVARLRTPPVVGRVPAGTPAEAAGLREGDRIRTVGRVPVGGFFDAQRRLAPAGEEGGAAGPADPPGTRIPIEVQRGVAAMRLEWIVPERPPPGPAAEAWGLLPPETWRVAGVHAENRGTLLPGDEVVSFVAGGATVPAGEPGAHGRFHDALFAADGGTVAVVARRTGRELPLLTATVVTEGGAAPAVRFERLRERGPAAGPGAVLGEIGEIGWRSVAGLPGSILDSLLSKPKAAEKGWLYEAVREDPWRVLHVFGFLHAFLLFLNLLPIPPLDGFQLLCCGLEMLAGRPLPKGGVAKALRVGWAIMAAWLVLNAVLVIRDLAGV
jgi:membrane-associated protease RseP (regulator of RpoE activity)